MKKIILLSLITFGALQADVINLSTFGGTINYSSNSLKDKGYSTGIYFSKGNLSYLFETQYERTNIKYKNNAFKHLIQNEITMRYSSYYKNAFWRIGLHANSTNDITLNNGNTAILGAGYYIYNKNNKLELSSNVYYSLYANGTDLNLTKKNIDITQISPELKYTYGSGNFKSILSLKYNYEISNYSKDKTLNSVEGSLYLGYSNFFLSGSVYSGKMRTGVKNGGFSVINSKDLYKNGYNINTGFYIRNFNVKVSYGENTFNEFLVAKNVKNNLMYVSIGYRF